MAQFEIPQINVNSISKVDTFNTSNELPFVPFSVNDDELEFAAKD